MLLHYHSFQSIQLSSIFFYSPNTPPKARSPIMQLTSFIHTTCALMTMANPVSGLPGGSSAGNLVPRDDDIKPACGNSPSAFVKADGATISSRLRTDHPNDGFTMLHNTMQGQTIRSAQVCLNNQGTFSQTRTVATLAVADATDEVLKRCCPDDTVPCQGGLGSVKSTDGKKTFPLVVASGTVNCETIKAVESKFF
ncbi:hypothetical protein MCOR02_006511 [Pyricularia oryzae]|nr:hypothetical protein MCOR02_006511 [Pyricularia oryzae]KAI6570225.1 hypothetical protein MCOR04_008153 [Pyricularia oryzae]